MTATRIVSDLPYYSPERADLTPYQRERCRLDVSAPEGATGLPVVVWFHGGGLAWGDKAIPELFQNRDLVVMSANYRLSPQVQCPAYLEDAAAAVAWAFRHAAEYGGRADRIFVAGHSSGAYLSLMMGLDKRWLGAHGIDADRLAGLVPLSGHAITHFTIRKERGITERQPVVDDGAPLFHARAAAFPILLVTGDREKEMLGRYEENAYLMRMLKINGHSRVTLYELEGYGHGMFEPAVPLMMEFIQSVMTAGGG